MPPITRRGEPTAEAFLATLARSLLIERSRIERLLADVPAQSRLEARSLANALVESGHLTHYQADKILHGLWQGLVLGSYHVLAPLGRGGMGTVYLARDRRESDALIALKILPPKRAREEANALARFRREMDLGKRLAHPNVTRTLDAGTIGGVHFIAMEYVPGESLRRLVGRNGPLSVGEAARIFADVACGLSHAHKRGLIHRDLKPSNIMVTPQGTAKILDLGLAILMDEETPDHCQVVGGEGYILGTMDYIAPEQTENARNVGPAADLYSLGASLYYTVTGVPPFPGGSAKQKMRWHRLESPPSVRSLNPSIPPEFAAFVEELLAKRPAERPESAAIVQERLKPWAAAPASSLVALAAATSSAETVVAFDSRDFDPSLWEAPSPVIAAEAAAGNPQQAVPEFDDDPPLSRSWSVLLVIPAVFLLLVLMRCR